MLRLLATILLLTVPLLAAVPARAQQMVRVPAGEFTMGSARGHADERPPRKVRLPAFLLDRYEVTDAQYGRCVKAGACKTPRRYPPSGKLAPKARASLPVVGVTWHDARAYCRWAGKQLPSEAQ